MSRGRWQNQSVLVTGAAGGLGLALAKEWGRRGARLWLADIDVPAVSAAAASLAAEGLDAAAIVLDVTDEAAVGRAVARVVAEHGRLDVIVNNAAIDVTGEVARLDRRHWSDVLDVNLNGVVNGIHHGYRQMVNQGNGLVVNVASGAALLGFPTSIPYTTSKAAVVGMSRALRAEAEVHGVRVALVFPGMMRTRIQRHEGIGIDRDAFLQRLPVQWLTVERAASRILNGLERGRTEITTQSRNRIGAWLFGVFPWLGNRVRRRIVRDFHALADSDGR